VRGVTDAPAPSGPTGPQEDPVTDPIAAAEAAATPADDDAPIYLDGAQLRALGARRRRRPGGARCRNCGALTGGTGTGLGRCSACYRYRLRHGEDHRARRTPDALVAWQAGELSEGQAARLLGVDRLELRRQRDEALARAAAVWAAEARERRVARGAGG
jgi:hypothetical protein